MVLCTKWFLKKSDSLSDNDFIWSLFHVICHTEPYLRLKLESVFLILISLLGALEMWNATWATLVLFVWNLCSVYYDLLTSWCMWIECILLPLYVKWWPMFLQRNWTKRNLLRSLKCGFDFEILFSYWGPWLLLLKEIGLIIADLLQGSSKVTESVNGTLLSLWNPHMIQNMTECLRRMFPHKDLT